MEKNKNNQPQDFRNAFNKKEEKKVSKKEEKKNLIEKIEASLQHADKKTKIELIILGVAIITLLIIFLFFTDAFIKQEPQAPPPSERFSPREMEKYFNQ